MKKPSLKVSVLAIAKRILELHSSEISVVSQERQGTWFRFDLPVDARAA